MKKLSILLYGSENNNQDTNETEIETKTRRNNIEKEYIDDIQIVNTPDKTAIKIIGTGSFDFLSEYIIKININILGNIVIAKTVINSTIDNPENVPIFIHLLLY